MKRPFILMFIFLFSFISLTSIADERPRLTLPFTTEENYDGYLFIWYTFKLANIDLPKIRTVDIPNSSHFKRIKKPKEFSIAWWPDYAVLLNEKTKTSFSILTPEGIKNLDELENQKGEAVFYDYIGDKK